MLFYTSDYSPMYLADSLQDCKSHIAPMGYSKISLAYDLQHSNPMIVS
jgi:hypothetical protein